jgi:hypothetical protein
MDQAFKCYIRQVGDKRTSDVQEDIMRKRREDALLRLAKIQNGKDPAYVNGHGGKKG